MSNPCFLIFAAAMATAVSPLDAATPAAAEIKPAAAAVSGKLEVGSPVPEFKPAKWIQGEPVTAFEKDKVYIIECWATWCAPCVAAIPHVNALHSQFKDKGLVVIGADVWEEPADKAEAFVKKKGDGMAYRVVYDGKDGAFIKDWMKAAGVHAIPHTFVVRDNKLIWQGHPGGLSEAVVADMLSGKYDTAKAATVDKERRAQVSDRRDDQARFVALQRKFAKQLKAKQFTEANVTLGEAEILCLKLMPSNLRLLQENSAIEIALAKGDKKAAVARLRNCVEVCRENPKHIDFVWRAALRTVSDTGFAGERDYAAGLEFVDLYIAKSAFGKEPVPRFLRARLLQATGKVDEAKAVLAGLAGFSAKLEGWKEASEALDAGKDWPAGNLNPDALPAAAPVAPIAK